MNINPNNSCLSSFHEEEMFMVQSNILKRLFQSLLDYYLEESHGKNYNIGGCFLMEY